MLEEAMGLAEMSQELEKVALRSLQLLEEAENA